MRKVFRNGNSLAVTVPKAYVHQLNIREGSKVEWKESSKGLLLLTAKKVSASNVNQRFAQMVDEFISDHKDVLKELSQR